MERNQAGIPARRRTQPLPGSLARLFRHVKAEQELCRA
jgi:hypothetical protein